VGLSALAAATLGVPVYQALASSGYAVLLRVRITSVQPPPSVVISQ